MPGTRNRVVQACLVLWDVPLLLYKYKYPLWTPLAGIPPRLHFVSNRVFKERDAKHHKPRGPQDQLRLCFVKNHFFDEAGFKSARERNFPHCLGFAAKLHCSAAAGPPRSSWITFGCASLKIPPPPGQFVLCARVLVLAAFFFSGNIAHDQLLSLTCAYSPTERLTLFGSGRSVP